MDVIEDSSRWQGIETTATAEGNKPVAPIQFSIWSLLNLTVLFAIIFTLARHHHYLALTWLVLCIPAGARTFCFVRIQRSLGYSVETFPLVLHFVGSLGWMMLVVYFTVLTTLLAAVLSAMAMMFFIGDVFGGVVIGCTGITAFVSALWMTYTTWPGRGDCH